MPEQDMTVAELIMMFESDIEFDCHSYRARYGRSLARKELVCRGSTTIPEIENHLRLNPPTDKPHRLETAWKDLRQELRMVAA